TASANPQVLAALRQVQVFRVLDAGGYRRLAEFATPRRYSAGDVVVREGESGDSLFVIVHGQASVAVSDVADETPRRVATVRDGDFFGEMSIVGNPLRAATISAESALLVLEIAA